jgi:four helix bundle protein
MYQSFEDLDVWKRGCGLVLDVHQAFRCVQEFWLRDHVLRTALSIPSNIAEGAERNSRREFVRFLAYAKGSAGELRTQIYVAMQIGAIDNVAGNALVDETKRISGMLHNLAQSLARTAAPRSAP